MRVAVTGRHGSLGGSVMLSSAFVHEMQSDWLPNVSDAGLARLIDLLEKGSPLLLSGAFTEALPRGCLATHIGWHHPAVCHRTLDAGILWLTRVARLNPATSQVIQEWDRRGPQDWEFRRDLLELLKDERAARAELGGDPQAGTPTQPRSPNAVAV